ncbi:MAG: thiamine pyrophosphate-dependent enzyme, partial [Rhodoplanes sp.]
NSSAALLTAYSMNAPVLALIGEIPAADIGLHLGHLHEIRDQAGILSRLVDYSALIRGPEQAPRLVAEAIRSMATGRPGPAALQCSIDIWGKSGPVTPQPPLPVRQPKLDETALRKAAKLLGAAKNPMIVCGGGAQDASEEVTALSAMLQAPVLGYRRGRGVLDSRDPLSVTLPLGYEMWPDTDVVLGIGTRLLIQFRQWGVDKDLKVIRIDADPKEPGRLHKPAAALIGDAKPVLKRLLELIPANNRKRPSRQAEMTERQAATRKRLQAIKPQLAYLDAIRAELPEDGILVDEVTQMGFAARIAFPVYKPRTFISPGYQDNLGWGYATSLGAQDARRDVPVLSITGDGGFMFTANEMATAVRHRIPLTTIVFNDGAFGNVRRIQQEKYGNRLIASDLANPDFVRFAESFGASGERARNPEELRAALRRAFARRDGPSLVEVPVGPFPSPWPFLHMPPVRGG